MNAILHDPKPSPQSDQPPTDDTISLLQLVLVLVAAWKRLTVLPLAAGVIALGLSYLIQPTFTSKTLFLPPQQQQSAASSALAQLGALGGLAGAAAGIKSPADQYVALLLSDNVTDRLIDEFKLIDQYGVDYRFEARRTLLRSMRAMVGKKDGLISVEVDDVDPDRAAAITNRAIEELRRLINELALTEAQQRRVFFEAQLQQSRERLTQAQQALQASGFNASALRADARVEVENYARLRAEATSVEVRLQTLRRTLADTTPEVQQALSTLAALRSQLGRLAATPTSGADGPDYVTKFREFKYQESLFELFARQYELARLDESREGSLLQVVDIAKPAEWKSKPKRAAIALAALAATFVLIAFWTIASEGWRRWRNDPRNARDAERMRQALRR